LAAAPSLSEKKYSVRPPLPGSSPNHDLGALSVKTQGREGVKDFSRPTLSIFMGSRSPTHREPDAWGFEWGCFWRLFGFGGAGWLAAVAVPVAHPIGITIETGRPEMAKLANKKQILDDAGYRYDFDRSLYFNRKAKKAFSVEFIDDKAEGELKKRIAQKNDGREWLFFFNNPPSEAVKRELEESLE
jgi:hypothetical protein